MMRVTTSSLCILLIVGLYSCVPTVNVNIEEAGEMVGGRSSMPGDPGYLDYPETGGMNTSHNDHPELNPDTNPNNDPGRLSCNIGEPLGVCIACGPDNTEITAMNDDRCDMIDCSMLNRYRVVTDDQGQPECRLQEFQDGESNCQGPGACFSDPSRYCVSQVEMIVVSKEELECFTIEGCEGQVEPALTPKTGELCQGNQGTCNDQGVCEITESCLTLFSYEYNAANRLCNDRLVTENYCEFFVKADQGPWGDKMTCNQFCTAEGGTCLNGWGDDNDSCNKNDEVGCNDDFGDGICRCAPPNMP